MLRKSEVLTAIGTLGCAMGIGFIMQNSEVAEKRYGSAPVILADLAVPSGPVAAAKLEDRSLLDVKAITLISAEFDTAPAKFEPTSSVHVIKAKIDQPSAPEATLATSGDNPALAGKTCEIYASARTLPVAMVDLSLFAPCMPNETVTVHHNGMLFSETTSNKGYLSLTVPALTQEASFIIAFSSGEGAIATTVVDELANYDRAVLQWKGNAGFQIHAREFGAEYGAKGHLWQGSPGNPSMVVSGEGGFLTRQGDTSAAEPLLAEIYTFPRNTNGLSGDVILTVEAEVTNENCGLEVEAQSLEKQPDGQVRTRNLILPVPSCDSVGSFLVLNNLLQNLKVAAK
jgi:hypothetical protein